MPSLRRRGPAPVASKPAKPAKTGPTRRQRWGKRRETVGQLVQAFNQTRQKDSRLVPYVVVAVVVGLAVGLLVGFLIGHPVYCAVLGLVAGLVAALAIFGRRARSVGYSGIEGEPGAAAAVLQSMRGDWRITPAVAFTQQQDFVHRVVGKPGVVLVAEGAPGRTRRLLGQEMPKVRRLVGETPIYDVVVGDDEGQVPLRRLEGHMRKLPPNIKGPQIRSLDARLAAIKSGPTLPIPKGPVPTGRPSRKPR